MASWRWDVVTSLQCRRRRHFPFLPSSTGLNTAVVGRGFLSLTTRDVTRARFNLENLICRPLSRCHLPLGSPSSKRRGVRPCFVSVHATRHCFFIFSLVFCWSRLFLSSATGLNSPGRAGTSCFSRGSVFLQLCPVVLGIGRQWTLRDAVLGARPLSQTENHTWRRPGATAGVHARRAHMRLRVAEDERG